VFVLIDNSVSNFVRSECQSDCKMIISASANDSVSATMISAIMLSTVETIL
jgi:hypothetical protein